jgi:hypothetical protein
VPQIGATRVGCFPRVRQVVADSGSLHLEEYKDALIAVFGNEFYESLTWAPQNVTAIHLANQLTLHAKIFNRPLPEKLTADGGVILDPNQSWRMVLRLIDQKMQHLHDLGRVSEQELGGSAQQPITVLDVASRYFSAVYARARSGARVLPVSERSGLINHLGENKCEALQHKAGSPCFPLTGEERRRKGEPVMPPVSGHLRQ